MTYRWLTDLDAALNAGGVPYTEVPFSYSDPTGAPSWRERGRPASTGGFDPAGVLCHHTASPEGTTAETELRVILSGNGDAPGPISQLLVSRDARVWLVAAGRANHGGKGVRPGVDSGCHDMNAALIGIEASNNGVGERWSDAMCDVYAALVAALANHYGWATSDVFLHQTTGPPYGGCNSKIDPAGPWCREPHLVGSTTWALETWRGYVDEHRAGPTTPEPEPIGDDTMPAFINNGGYATFAMTGGFCSWIADPGDADRLGVPPANEHGQRGAAVSPSMFKGLILVGAMPPDFNEGWFAGWWPEGHP